MALVIKAICQNRIIIGLLLWFRELLVENKIPDTLFDRLKCYTHELSANMPDIEAVNKRLEYDISSLNRREELINIKPSGGKERGKVSQFNPIQESNVDNIIKYHAVKIIDYQDIIEVDIVRDRVFLIDIDMDAQNRIYNLFYKNPFYNKNFYYSVKLSTLERLSGFQL